MATGPVHDRQTKPHPRPDRHVVGPREFVENPFLVLGADADASIPDLKHDLVAPAPTAQQYPPAFGRVLDRVDHKVLDRPHQIPLIGPHQRTDRHHIQLHFLTCRQRRLILDHALHQRAQTDIGWRQRRVGGIQSRDIQKRVKQFLDRGERPLQTIHRARHGVVLGGFLQGRNQQLGRIDRLQQIVAGCRKEPCLGRHRRFGPFLGQTQFLFDPRLGLVLRGQAFVGLCQFQRPFVDALFQHFCRAAFQRDVLQFHKKTLIRQQMRMQVQNAPARVADPAAQPPLMGQTFAPQVHVQRGTVQNQSIDADEIQHLLQPCPLLQQRIGQAQQFAEPRVVHHHLAVLRKGADARRHVFKNGL